MKEIAEYTGMIGMENIVSVTSGIVRILLAAICGAVIGTERGRKHRPAGLRTHMLVCVAAALVMVTNEQLIQVYGRIMGKRLCRTCNWKRILSGGDSYLYFHSYYFYKIYRNRKAFRKKVAHNGNSGFF